MKEVFTYPSPNQLLEKHWSIRSDMYRLEQILYYIDGLLGMSV